MEFSRRKISGACALAAVHYPSVDLESWREGNGSNKSISTINLKCPENTHISTVKFASFGNPTGSCGSYTKGDCHDPNSTSVVEKVSTSNCLVRESNWMILLSCNSISWMFLVMRINLTFHHLMELSYCSSVDIILFCVYISILCCQFPDMLSTCCRYAYIKTTVP